MTFWLNHDIWRHNIVLAFIKSKYKYSGTKIAFCGWKYVSVQVSSSIRSFVGILTSFEWHFWLFHDIWRHIWRHNIVLPPSKSQNVIVLTPQSVFHSKTTHLYAFWDQHSHLIKISGVLGDFWFIFGHFWVHDVTKVVKIFRF